MTRSASYASPRTTVITPILPPGSTGRCLAASAAPASAALTARPQMMFERIATTSFVSASRQKVGPDGPAPLISCARCGKFGDIPRPPPPLADGGGPGGGMI
jgi:hypothetical protein